MLRTVVTFLVAVPLLMPPGMCICQFAPTARASTPPRSEDTGRQQVAHASGSRPDCRCDSCRERSPAGGDERGSRPADDAPPAGPGKHAPGCPAALGDIPTKMAAPAVTTHLDANPGLYFGSPVVGPTASLRRSRECVSVRATSPPLFISHCSLQI